MSAYRNGPDATDTNKHNSGSIDEILKKPEIDSGQGYDVQDGVLYHEADRHIERRLLRKLDFHVLPMLACMYLLK